MPKLTFTLIDNLWKAGIQAGKPNKYADVECPGLYFRVTGVKTASWVYRFRLHGKRPEIGLGAYPIVGLADARAVARAEAKLLADGIDPRQQRAAVQSKQKADAAKPRTIAELAAAYQKIKGWEPTPHYYDDNYGYATCLRIRKYILPELGDLFVEHIEGSHITKLLEPIWQAKPAQARAVYQAINDLLDYAVELHELLPSNPARRIGKYLQEQPAGSHMKALPWPQVPELITKLRNHKGTPRFRTDIDRRAVIAARNSGSTHREVGQQFGIPLTTAINIYKTRHHKYVDHSNVMPRAVEAVILSGLRTQEMRQTQWHEIDWQRKLLIIPRQRMKVKKGDDFILPLTARLLEIFDQMRILNAPGNYVFPGFWQARKTTERRQASGENPDPDGFPLDHQALLVFLKQTIGYKVTIHGFRSSFSDWAYAQKRFSVFAIEYSLDHKVHGRIPEYGSAIAGFYHRDRHLEERRELLEAWSNFCSGNSAEIIPLHQVPAA